MPQTIVLHTVTAAFTAFILFGCASSGGADDARTVERDGPLTAEAYDPEAAKVDRATGALLQEMDLAMRAWNNLVLRGKATQDLTRLDLLESTLRHDVQANHATLVDQLQTGPLVNRQIAAAALGFSDRPESLGPLLVALEDTSDQVVANALLGLSTLSVEKTQVGGIARLLSDPSKTIAVRSNAGRALRSMSLKALDDMAEDQVVDAARLALGDEEAAVRVHGALLLAEMVDTEAVDRLARLLDDPSPLVGRAASRAIARIGSIDDKTKGDATRALTAAIKRVDQDKVRPALMDDLQRMTRRNYGDDEDAWLEYAFKLP